MAVIFSASCDRRSFSHSSHIIAPIVRWFFPRISEEALHSVVILVRKGAHFTEFAILALLVWRALRKPVMRDPRSWNWPLAGKTLLLVLLYAASDEFHQRFVPTREASVVDVMIDTVGGAGGLFALWACGSRLRWWSRPPASNKRTTG